MFFCLWNCYYKSGEKYKSWNNKFWIKSNHLLRKSNSCKGSTDFIGWLKDFTILTKKQISLELLKHTAHWFKNWFRFIWERRGSHVLVFTTIATSEDLYSVFTALSLATITCVPYSVFTATIGLAAQSLYSSGIYSSCLTSKTNTCPQLTMLCVACCVTLQSGIANFCVMQCRKGEDLWR